MPLARPLTLSGLPLDRLARRLASHTARAEAGAELIWAAVALLLVDRGPASEGPALLLIRRAERAGDPWSGQMGLPGGRRDAEDADLVATAIRETAEEVGVRLPPSSLLGSLDDVAPRTPVLPPVAVRPFVFRLPAAPVLTPNPEVAATAWVPLGDLLAPGARRSVEVQIRGESRVVPAYVTPEGIVWGMTERILSLLFASVA